MKICEVCNKPYEYQLRTRYAEGEAYCYHDGEFVSSKYELVDRKTQQARETYAKDLIQPYNTDGTKNKDFTKIYGDKARNNFKKPKVKALID